MGNLSDYLMWRGDLPLTVDPFNDVDNLVLSELVYTNFDGIVPGPGFEHAISLSEACGKFFERYAPDEILDSVSSTKVAPFVMQQMAETRRFGNIQLTGYVNDIDTDVQSQFAVVTALLEDGSVFVAYRGTDSTIVGWKEDFNMSFLYQTPGQVKAAEYLNRNFSDKNCKLRIGGHSKGGNLAVYAAMSCLPQVREQIVNVYSNDGPGFLKEVTETEQYQSILPKVISIIPESSIVGMLLENPMEHRIVKSTQTGVMQHDLMSWEVMGKELEFAENISESSIMLDKTLKNWIYSLSVEERQQFVDLLFQSLEATGAKTLDDLSKSKLVLVNEVTKTLGGLQPEQQQALKDVVMRLAYSGGETLVDKANSERESLTNNMQERLLHRLTSEETISKLLSKAEKT